MQKNACAAVLFLASTLCVATALAATRPDESDLVRDACAAAVGTYLTENLPKPDPGHEQSRSLIALTNGGHVIFVDSGERGEAGYSPFSDGLGRWRCLSGVGEPIRFSGTILDFTIPKDGPQQIARLDFSGAYDARTETMRTTFTLHFVPIHSDPLDRAALKGGIRFETIGRKVVAYTPATNNSEKRQ